MKTRHHNSNWSIRHLTFLTPTVLNEKIIINPPLSSSLKQKTFIWPCYTASPIKPATKHMFRNSSTITALFTWIVPKMPLLNWSVPWSMPSNTTPVSSKRTGMHVETRLQPLPHHTQSWLVQSRVRVVCLLFLTPCSNDHWLPPFLCCSSAASSLLCDERTIFLISQIIASSLPHISSKQTSPLNWRVNEQQMI